MVSHVALICIAVASTLRDAVGRAEPGAPCPACLNGGLCLPSNADLRGTRTLQAGIATRCFCPSPWRGESCEMHDLDDDPDFLGLLQSLPRMAPVQLGSLRNDVQAPMSDRRHMEKDTTESFHKVLMVNLKLDARADPGLRDDEGIRFTVYSTLCPSSPCPSGLVLEDIRMLSLSEDSKHVTEAHLAISPPFSSSGQSGQGSAIEAIQAELQSHLLEQKNFNTDGFGDHILDAGFQLADASGVLKELATKDVPVHVMMNRIEGRNQTAVSDERWVAARGDGNVSLYESKEASCAIWCISVLVLVFLLISVANVSMERACRWLYPSELESSHPEGDTEEFEEIKPQDHDFHMIRAILEVAKVSLGPVVVKASLMYMVQSRAHELTRGFGHPPEWAEHSMKIMTAADLFLVTITSALIFRSTERVQSIKHALYHVFANPHWVYLVLWTVVQIVQAASTISLLYCVITLTPEDCRVPGNVSSEGFWQGRSPPSLSVEYQTCVVFVVQMLILLHLESAVCTAHCWRIQSSSDEEERKATKRELKLNVSKYRHLTKTGGVCTLLLVITLALREVPALARFDKDFRSGCLMAVAAVLIIYSIFTVICVLGQIVEVDLTESVTSLSSATDSIAYTGRDTKDSVFRAIRRILLITAYALTFTLVISAFNLAGDAGPAPVVPWPIMWALFIMSQCVCVHFLCLLHEIFEGHSQDKASNLEALGSSIREIEGFMALTPMLGLTFLCAHSRALMVMRTGELPQWVLTAMNAVAQALALQLVVALLEATIGGAIFTDQKNWSHLKRSDTADQGRSSDDFLLLDAALDGRPWDPPLVDGLLDRTLPTGSPRPWDPQPDGTAAIQGPKPSPRGIAIQESLKRLEEEAAGRAPIGLERLDARRQAFASRSMSRLSDTPDVEVEYEVHFLATRSLNLICTISQLFLLGCLYVSIQLILIATWTMDADMPRKTYSSGDWRSSLFPLLPVSASTTTAMETMVWLVALFFTGKFASSFLLSLRYLYQTVQWSALAAVHGVSQVVDLIPLIILLHVMVQSRAACFHGLNTSPSSFVQVHMIVIIVSMTVQCLAIVATPAFTGELTRKEDKAHIIPAVRRMFSFIETLASIAMYWGIFVLLLSIVMMTPEDVVMSNGTTGAPWQGKGEVPRLPFLAWDMWCLCIMTFFVTGLHRIFHQMIIRKRYAEGEDRGKKHSRADAWFRKNKNSQIIRWHHATVLARHSALGSILLGLLFILLERIMLPGVGGSMPRVVREDKISPGMLTFMEMLFFLASFVLAVKTFLVFCYGTLKEPTLGEAFKDSAKSSETGQPDLEHPVLDRQVSRDFDLQSGSASPHPLAVSFKRLALAMHACESIAVVTLTIILFSIIHEHTSIFSRTNGGFLNGSIYLLALCQLTHSGWGFLVLGGFRDREGLNSRSSDGLLDVASACPVIVLLFMACRQRSLEVAGRHGVVPEWMQHLIFTCSIIILIEFLAVLLAPPSKPRTQQVHQQSLRQQATEFPSREEREQASTEEQEQTYWQRNWRVAYLTVRMLLRFSAYSCIGAVVFGLFWMTEEQCLPRNHVAE